MDELDDGDLAYKEYLIEICNKIINNQNFHIRSGITRITIKDKKIILKIKKLILTANTKIDLNDGCHSLDLFISKNTK